MADNKASSDKEHERDQLAQRGENQGAQGGRTGGEAEGDSSGQTAQTRPGGSAPGGQSPERAREGLPTSQGLAGAQGSGGGAERGMTQDPDARNRTSGAGNT